MSAPQELTNLIDGLESDKQDVGAKTSDKAAKDQAAADAQVAALNAGHDLDASKAHQAADLAAAHAKLDALYGQS
jgi:hypothetical protein